jgi:hypothetical protein
LLWLCLAALVLEGGAAIMQHLVLQAFYIAALKTRDRLPPKIFGGIGG